LAPNPDLDASAAPSAGAATKQTERRPARRLRRMRVTVLDIG
jgi:hypothetical protein